MGGKSSGGGGGGGGDTPFNGDNQMTRNGFAWDPNMPTDSNMTGGWVTKAEYDAKYPAAPAAAAPVAAAVAAPEEAAPAAQEAAPADPAPADPAPDAVPQIGTGSAIAGPTSLGNQLGKVAGAQNFWVGGINSSKNTKSGKGSLNTTQT